MDDNDFYEEDDSPEEIEEMWQDAWDTTFRALGPPVSESPRKFDFSQFHPLDHPIWHPYCRSVGNFPTAPKGWKNHCLHLTFWWKYAWRDPFDGVSSWRDKLWAIT